MWIILYIIFLVLSFPKSLEAAYLPRMAPSYLSKNSGPAVDYLTALEFENYFMKKSSESPYQLSLRGYSDVLPFDSHEYDRVLMQRIMTTVGRNEITANKLEGLLKEAKAMLQKMNSSGATKTCVEVAACAAVLILLYRYWPFGGGANQIEQRPPRDVRGGFEQGEQPRGVPPHENPPRRPLQITQAAENNLRRPLQITQVADNNPPDTLGYWGRMARYVEEFQEASPSPFQFGNTESVAQPVHPIINLDDLFEEPIAHEIGQMNMGERLSVNKLVDSLLGNPQFVEDTKGIVASNCFKCIT